MIKICLIFFVWFWATLAVLREIILLNIYYFYGRYFHTCSRFNCQNSIAYGPFILFLKMSMNDRVFLRSHLSGPYFFHPLLQWSTNMNRLGSLLFSLHNLSARMWTNNIYHFCLGFLFLNTLCVKIICIYVFHVCYLLCCLFLHCYKLFTFPPSGRHLFGLVALLNLPLWVFWVFFYIYIYVCWVRCRRIFYFSR